MPSWPSSRAIADEMEQSYDDYDRFRDLDNAFHAIIMRASGNEIALTIVRVIHRHGGATAPLARAPLEGGAQAHCCRAPRRYWRRSPLGDGELAGERVSAHIEARWDETEETQEPP